MKIKNYILVLPAVVALLLTAVCCNNNEIVEVPDLEQARIIPYTVSVGSSVATRAVLNDSNFYEFESGDKLYVWGEKISGELTMTDGAGKYTATFSGNLTWTGSTALPEDDLDMYAVIVSPGSQIFGTLAEFAANNYEPDYSAAVLDTDLKEAVRKIGYFKARSTYGYKNFDFCGQQFCAFVFFNITLEDGTTEGSDIVVTISNNKKQECKGTIKAVKEYNEIRAKFVAGFPSLSTYMSAPSTPAWYQLNEATVKLDNRDTLQFGGNSLLVGNMVYNVERNPRYTITASASNPLTGELLPSQTVTDKKMGYTTELQSMMSTMGLSSVLAYMNINVTGCERTSPDKDWSVDCVEKTGSNPLDYTFTVVGTGDTVFTIKTDSSVPMLKSIPVTISVVKE